MEVDPIPFIRGKNFVNLIDRIVNSIDYSFIFDLSIFHSENTQTIPDFRICMYNSLKYIDVIFVKLID